MRRPERRSIDSAPVIAQRSPFVRSAVAGIRATAHDTVDHNVAAIGKQRSIDDDGRLRCGKLTNEWKKERGKSRKGVSTGAAVRVCQVDFYVVQRVRQTSSSLGAIF